MSNAKTTGSLGPKACPDCLRRMRLLGHLAPYIEKFVGADPALGVGPLMRLSNKDLVGTVAPNASRRILGEIDSIAEGDLQRAIEAAQCWACCQHDPLYPGGLRDDDAAPWALAGRGEPRLLGELALPANAVAIVGSRRATSYGREVARELGRDLAAAGLTVISGMAFGIDACAHRGALESGRTVAVLGCGPDIAYPASHRALWRRIQEGGLVLSELPPGTGAWRWSFPARNRIIAALSGMTVLVEAAGRSGSLTTAELAGELGRELGAVPGPVNSSNSVGPNGLLAGGAHVVRGAEDVLRAMRRAESPASYAGLQTKDEARAMLESLDLYASGTGEDRQEMIAAAVELVGETVCDSLGRTWKVTHVGAKDGWPTIAGDAYWDRVVGVTPLGPADRASC